MVSNRNKQNWLGLVHEISVLVLLEPPSAYDSVTILFRINTASLFVNQVLYLTLREFFHTLGVTRP